MVDSIVEYSPPVDWDYLRTEGLKHLQEMTGNLWTDYNIHDPGVTLFEALCYGIEELNNRIAQDIEVHLADDFNESEGRFFSPNETLTINPVTINDYRKLLIDIPGVKNAWLESVSDTDPDIYYDKDNNSLLYDYASKAQKLYLNGLYRVHIEKEETVTDDPGLRDQVKATLHAHRNLCEDFEEIRIMEQETIFLYTDIQIDENADANDVMGGIYYDLKNFVSPTIRQYGLKRMLKKGKTVEQIFNGPMLNNGFIDDDELGIDQKRREMHTSDLIRIIMSHPEVKDVRNLFIANVSSSDEAIRKEWALVLDDTKALVLEPFNPTNIKMFKKETLCDVDRNKILIKVDGLETQAQKEAFGESDTIEFTRSNYTAELIEYNAVGDQLPSNFGISKTGLPSSATIVRKAQARQLKAYLLFFEQILVNYLCQLESFKDIFALKQNRQDILKTYFSRLLPESLWKEDFPEIVNGYVYREDGLNEGAYQDENAFARKNRILNHLLALFNEKFADYTIIGYRKTSLDTGDKKPTFLNIKADFLRNFPRLSRNRNRAYDTLITEGSNFNISGLKELIGHKLGFDSHEPDSSIKTESDNFHIVEHILLRPSGKLSLDFICSENIKEDLQPDPYSYKVTFVIPKQLGRFQDSAFKQLVYDTIEEEIPAHITYRVLEFDSNQLSLFNTVYQNYLLELNTIQTSESDFYNPYRNELIELLGLGRIRLPVLHLDAYDVNGDYVQDFGSDESTTDQISDGDTVDTWYDLSRNNNHAAKTSGSDIVYIKPADNPPYLRFDNTDQLEISRRLITESFTIAIVVNPAISTGHEDDSYPLIKGDTALLGNFAVSIKGNGSIVASVNQNTVELYSTLNTTHMLIFAGDLESGEIHLTIDGEHYQFAAAPEWDLALDYQKIVIGAGNGHATFDYGEIAILDSVLSGSRKRKLEEHLAEKWGIALSVIQSIEKPVLHLDAGHLNSVTSEISTGKLSQWNDLSETGINAVQLNLKSRPIYDQSGLSKRPSILFSGTQSLSLISETGSLLGSEFTIAVIYQSEINEGQLLTGMIASQDGDTTAFKLQIGKMGAIQIELGNETHEISASLKKPHLIVLTGSDSGSAVDLSLYLDGKAFARAQLSNSGLISSGSKKMLIGDNLKGEVGEIVFFNKVFTVLERQRLEDYLSRKWKIDTTGVNPITKPVVHLDAARLTTVKEEQSLVVQWDDISPYLNHAVQEGDQRRPEYIKTGPDQLGTIRFTQLEKGEKDFYDDSLVIDRTVQDDFTIFIIFKPQSAYYIGTGSELDFDVTENTQWTEGVAIIDGDCSGVYNDFGLSFGKKGSNMIVMAGVGDRNTKDHTIHTRELNFENFNMITFSRVKETGIVKLYANGLLHTTADLVDDAILNDCKKIKIGAFNSEGIPFRGDVGEVIILDHVLTDAKRQQIEEYLSSKWSIPIQRLPIDTSEIWLHFDANERSTVVTDDTYKVSAWEGTDKSLVASQDNENERPEYVTEAVNGMPGIRFNNSYLELLSNLGSYTKYTIAVVFNAFSWGNSLRSQDYVNPADVWEYGAALIDSYDETNLNSGFGITTRQDADTGGVELTTRIGDSSAAGSLKVQSPHIAVVMGDTVSGKTRTFIDGLEAENSFTPDPAVSLSSVSKVTIGATQLQTYLKKDGFFHGDIAEIIYIRDLPATEDLRVLERQTLEKHLSQKWGIDISGINSIAKPVFHLDASMISTLVYQADQQDPNVLLVEKWLDRNAHEYSAIQSDSALCPSYIKDNQDRLPVVRFENSYLTFPRIVEDDFTIAVVYKADADLDPAEYMPVSQDAFGDLAGIDPDLSIQLWNLLQNRGYFDILGNVSTTNFTPHEEGFDLNLETISLEIPKKAIELQVIDIMSEYQSLSAAIPSEKFSVIGGINKILSAEIWNQLIFMNLLDKHGYVRTVLIEGDGTFDEYLNGLVKSAIIHIIMADNWFEGVGLIDGNAPGDNEDLYKRDFGLLVGKSKQGEEDKLIAGMGVIGEEDQKLEVVASKDEFHVAVMTRGKNSGIVTLTLDDNLPESSNMARGLPLRDSQRFTIGAFNTGGNHFKGDIGEIIILDKELSSAEVKSVQRYLAKKWKVGQ